MAESNYNTEPIVYEWEAVSTESMDALTRATRSTHVRTMPPTFPTIYRWGEFEWMARLGYDLRNLLHTEQEYEYLAPLVIGEKPKITTSLKNNKVKAGMCFLSVESVIVSGGRIAVRVLSSFVIKGVTK